MTQANPVDVDRIVWAVNALDRRRLGTVLDDIKARSGRDAARLALAEATVIIVGSPAVYRPQHRRQNTSRRIANRAKATS